MKESRKRSRIEEEEGEEVAFNLHVFHHVVTLENFQKINNGIFYNMQVLLFRKKHAMSTLLCYHLRNQFKVGY
jgi:hypothetical protein